MNKSTIWGIIVVLVLIIGGVWVSKKADKTEPVAISGEAIKIGAILPLTGNGADQGEWVRQGLELALDEINSESKQNLEIVYEDSHGDPKTAVSIYTDLTSRMKIPVFLTWGSGVGLALTPLVNRDQIIQMGVATAASSYSTPDDFTFRNFPSADLEANFLADVVLNKLGKSKVVILKLNNDYGLSSAKSFRSFFEKAGGAVLTEETFEPNTTDFRTQLAKIKTSSKDDLIFLASYPKEGALLLRQARELGLINQFVASVAILGGKDFFSLAGNSAEGLLVVTSTPDLSDNSNSEIEHFAELYYKKYGAYPGVQELYGARAYDALKVIALAMSKCNQPSDPSCIKDELFKMESYQGASGNMGFDKNGDIAANFNLVQVKNKEFVKN